MIHLWPLFQVVASGVAVRNLWAKKEPFVHNMALVAGLSAVILYLLASWISGRALWANRPQQRIPVMALGGLALPLQLLSLHEQIHGPAGLDLSLFHMLALVSWMMAMLTVLFSIYRPVISLSALAFPLAGMSTLASLLIPLTYHPVEHLSHAGEAHVLFSILAYSLFFVAAGLAMLLFILNRRLKLKQPLPTLRLLPPLQTLETLLFETLVAGWILLTPAIVLGLFVVHDLRAEHLVHKTVFSVAAWLLFATLIAGRYRLGWRGPRAVRMTLFGFALLIVGFYGSKAVLELVLHVN